jgi:hypothetical protein
MRVYNDLGAKTGVMRVTEYKRRCVLREQSLIKRKLTFSRAMMESLMRFWISCSIST